MGTFCCPKSIKACRIRVTRNDECGAALVHSQNPNSRITTKGFVSLTMSPDTEDGEEILVKDGCGDICIHDIDCSRIKGFELTLMLCGIPVPMIGLLLNSQMFLDGTVPRGFMMPDVNDVDCDGSRQVEIWAKNAEKGKCATDEAWPWFQWLIPKSINWVLSGDIGFANDNAVELELEGYAESNPNWTPSVPGEWILPDDQAVVQNGGPVGGICTNTLPDSIDCDYDPV